MSYPASYRRRVAGPQQARGSFWRNESGFLRFPDGRGTWQHPTGDPVAPARPLIRPPPPEPLIPPDPATRPQQDIPWWERGRAQRRNTFHLPIGRTLGYVGLALGVAEMLWPGDQWRYPHVPPPAGWSHVCGPTPWPGPPYAQATRTLFAAGICTTPGCGVGLQSIAGFTYLPAANSRCMRTYWGPNVALLPAERYFLSDQYTVNPALNNVQVMAHYPTQVSSRVSLYLPPGLHVEVMPMPLSLWEIPATQSDPRVGVTERVDGASETRTATATLTQAQPAPRGLSFQPNYPEVRPPPRTREQKINAAAGAAFRFLGAIGTWHSFVNALWRSLPPKYSHKRRSFAGKLQDIYQHWDEVDLDRAARVLFQYWVMYKAAGWAYGSAYNYLVRVYGPREGPEIYRSLVRAGML